MQISEADNPHVHDLLQIDPDLLNDLAAPPWAKETLKSCPWVIVRRAESSADQIAVGVRGNSRNERWGGFLRKNFIHRIIRPPELLIFWRSAICDGRAPAMKVLQKVFERWRDRFQSKHACCRGSCVSPKKRKPIPERDRLCREMYPQLQLPIHL
jgi:hypothetical protein